MATQRTTFVILGAVRTQTFNYIKRLGFRKVGFIDSSSWVDGGQAV